MSVKLHSADVSAGDRTVLRDLGEQLAEIAALPVHAERAAMWRDLNGLKRVRPLVWINEVPWHEMDVDGELRLRTTTAWCRYHEWELRSLLYQWKHFPGDMVVEPTVFSPLVIHNTGFGIAENVDIVKTDDASDVVSRHFNFQIRDEEDLEKIETPVVAHDAVASEEHCQQLKEIFGGVLHVEKRGAPGFVTWFAPWDELIRWWGPQQALTDLVDKPDLVHKAMDRLVNAYLAMLDQWQDQNLLTLNNGYNRIGSGGLGYTDELPQPDFEPSHVRVKDLWGHGAAQIFSDVSPRMHWEFALQYELRWLSRFGLTYYGCCDPLHRKMRMLEKIPNLRKVSMSPWINVDEAVATVGDRYVFSYKPSPAVFAEETWHLDKARRDLETVLTKAKAHDCIVEVIMKDISTMRHQPQRLWEWAAMAAEVTQEYA